MDIQLLFAGAEGHGFVHIREKLLGIARLAGVISRRLNAARQRSVMVKADNVIALPAVQGNRHALELFHSGFNVNAELAVYFFCVFKYCVHIFISLNR